MVIETFHCKCNLLHVGKLLKLDLNFSIAFWLISAKTPNPLNFKLPFDSLCWSQARKVRAVSPPCSAVKSRSFSQGHLVGSGKQKDQKDYIYIYIY